MDRRRRGLNARLISVGTVLALAWVGIGYRLAVVQGMEADVFAARGLDQRLQREVLAADRGTIFDRDGRELAVTVDAVTVYANPLEIEAYDFPVPFERGALFADLHGDGR